MGAAARLASRSLLRRFALFLFFLTLFALFSGVLYRTLTHKEIIITPPDGTQRTVALMQRLDGIDADYRLQKDGTVAVDGGDVVLLAEAGLPVSEIRNARPLGQQLALALFILFSGVLALMAARSVLRELLGTGPKRKRTAAAVKMPPTAKRKEAEPSLKPHPAMRPAGSANLFEDEHPQTVAVYLLGLDATEAAADVEAMAPLQREQVWKRVVLSGECDPQLRQKVTELFAHKRKRLQRRLLSPETMEKTAAIFRQLSTETRQELLDMLREDEGGVEIAAWLEAKR